MGRIEFENKIKQLNPTMLLEIVLLASFSFILASGVLIASFGLPWFWYVPLFALQTLVVFLMFTPLHDGVHYQVSKNRFWNEVFLFLTWPVFISNPFFFRKIHFQHHSRTNQGKQDPDHFTSSRKLWKRIAKSFLLIFYYHWFFFKRIRSLKDLGHWVASTVFPLLIFNLSIVLIKGPGTALLAVWIIPTFVGVGILAYANTAWPHHPGREVSRYRATRNTYVPWLVQVLMLNQNLHLVHHLKPNMPWYQYPEYLRRHQAELQREGSQTIVYTRRSEPYSLIPEWATRVIDHFGF